MYIGIIRSFGDNISIVSLCKSNRKASNVLNQIRILSEKLELSNQFETSNNITATTPCTVHTLNMEY